MKVVLAESVSLGLVQLGVSKTSYHRWKRQGKAHAEMEVRDGKKLWKITIIASQDGLHNEASTMDPLIEAALFGHKQHVEGWIEWRDSGLGQAIWSETYRNKMIRFSERYFNRFENISLEDLKTWLKECSPLQYSTRVDRHAFVSSMAKYLLEEMNGAISQDEYIKIKMLYPRKPPGYEPTQRIITEDDLNAILEALPKHLKGKEYQVLLAKTIIILLSETAMRINELVSTPLEKYRFSDNFSQAIVTVKGKGSKTRSIPFPKRAQEALKAYLDAKPPEADTGSLFSVYHDKKKEYTPLKDRWLQKFFEDLSKAIGILFSAHSFRHFRITQWANNAKIPITVTQKWAGHSSLMVTQRYIHLTDEMAMAAAFA